MAEGRGGVVDKSVDHTTPSAPLRMLRTFFLLAQPPLLARHSCPNCPRTPARVRRRGFEETKPRVSLRSTRGCYSEQPSGLRFTRRRRAGM